MFRQLFIDQNSNTLNQLIQDKIINPMKCGHYSNASKASLTVALHAVESNVIIHKVFIILLWLYCCNEFQEYFFSQDKESHSQVRELMMRKIELHFDLWLQGLCYEKASNNGILFDNNMPKYQNKFGWAVLRIRQYYLAL